MSIVVYLLKCFKIK